MKEPYNNNGTAKEELHNKFNEAKKEASEIGGWESFKNGTWFFKLIQKSFKNYLKNGNTEYFEKKYNSTSRNYLAKKLTNVAASNAAILGGIVGATVSANEIAAIVQTMATVPTAGTSNIPLPAEISLVATTLTAEAILLVRFQLELVVNIAKLYGVPLDPDDPEDVLTIFAFAIGGLGAESAGKIGMKVGGNVAGRTAKAIFKKELLVAIKKIAQRLGIKILQRTIVKYSIPIASIAIGTSWNYISTISVSKIAQKHFKGRLNEILKTSVKEEKDMEMKDRIDISEHQFETMV